MFLMALRMSPFDNYLLKTPFLEYSLLTQLRSRAKMVDIWGYWCSDSFATAFNL